ncbi:glutamate racemase MurI [Thermoclostridium stercorarium subsp. stercorarium DSM 8532]|jgi:glutamate racemase|uniref:Glutamate racemase n=3 Tax=Thermoclostridium stercorarium TaxID=1510 RepID=L7VMP1_THES1|nr:glutamate racemase [Thermoclostridium stercorarium]AGC69490.1 glutamate racemase MurI [Thermoclostridium stercorarium subsp. stercorarium DSM 8532]AGI40443.1 glutamate racemase [Thermoclostridium stercorarium subsp. stercorarium DSM 8532]ANW99731.1 glutamate racemase [Thermoclostridium stercorarium subsp. thermolacticum DSM 2910]ANX02357.1 glutamate racemase [Thermoclostridium stercorarium subsp. leptospartum DSM 9219]
MDNRPIGVFDSGLGGLTVVKEIMKQLPSESIIYFGDDGRAPYGTKSRETVIQYTKQDMAFLLSMDVKLLVAACNTISAVALPELSTTVGVPVLGVIESGAKSALKKTKHGRIGVIATPATIQSGVYYEAIKKVNPGVQIFSKACPLFVNLAEEGWWDNEIARMVAEEYLKELKQAQIDTLVLGCTHYPLLADTIRKVMGDDVVLVSSAEELAVALKETLRKENLESRNETATYRYYTSDSVEKFKKLGKMILGQEIANIERVDLENY